MKRTMLALLPLAALASLGASASFKPHSFTLRVEAEGSRAADFIATSNAELQLAGGDQAPARRVCGRTPASLRVWHGATAVTIQAVGPAQAVRVVQVDSLGRRVTAPVAGRHLNMRLDGARFLAATTVHRTAMAAANPCE